MQGEEDDQSRSSPPTTTTTTLSSESEPSTTTTTTTTIGNDQQEDITTTTIATENNEQNEQTAATIEAAAPKRSYSQHLQTFFPHLTSQIQFDSEDALSYLTPWRDAIEVAEEIHKMCHMHTHQYPQHIIDGTGGLGGNTIGFLNYFWKNHLRNKSVSMIELNRERYPMAVHNVELFIRDQEDKASASASSPTVLCESFNDNFVSWWRRVGTRKYNNFATLVFMDPPWGGQDYKQHEVIHDLYFDVDSSNDDDENNDKSIQNDENGNDSSNTTTTTTTKAKEKKQVSLKDFTMEILASGVMCVVLKVPHNYRDRTFTEHDSRLRLRCYVMKKVKYIMVFSPFSNRQQQQYQDSGSGSRGGGGGGGHYSSRSSSSSSSSYYHRGGGSGGGDGGSRDYQSRSSYGGGGGRGRGGGGGYHHSDHNNSGSSRHHPYGRNEGDGSRRYR